MYVIYHLYTLPSGRSFSIAEANVSQEVILDMFFEILNIGVPDWGQAFMDGRRLTSRSE